MSKKNNSNFKKRPLPNSQEIKKFNNILQEEIKDEYIENGLSEIYQDENGDIVNVKKLDIKKRNFLFDFLKFLFAIFIIGFLVYGFYLYFNPLEPENINLEANLKIPDRITNNEEFFIEIEYKNLSNIKIKQAILELSYPENFIFLDSNPPLQDPSKKGRWNLGEILANSIGSVNIQGKIINKKDNSNLFLANLRYIPENFSSEFKEEMSHSVLLTDIGLDLDFNYSENSLVSENNQIIISINTDEKNNIPEFKLNIEPIEDMEIIALEKIEDQDLNIEKINSYSYKITGLTPKIQDLIINYKFKKKKEEKQIFKIDFLLNEIDKSYSFFEKEIELKTFKSNLNLSLFVNEVNSNEAVNFGDKLNYKIEYINKGEVDIKDVVIMAVLESDFLNWTTLNDAKSGQEKGNTIIWNQNHIKDLKSIKPNKSGTIEFSIEVMPFYEDKTKIEDNLEIKSFVQFLIGNKDDQEKIEDNKSNIIINKINSNLELKEEIRYFNEDNNPVGLGPLPPKINKETEFRVYWTIKNSIHELNNLKVETKLPKYIKWKEDFNVSVGSILYDEKNHKIVWQIGRLPKTVYRADSEFNISLTPKEENLGKIMVLLNNTEVDGLDVSTKANIKKKLKSKTTKLEDDDIAQMSNDGLIVN